MFLNVTIFFWEMTIFKDILYTCKRCRGSSDYYKLQTRIAHNIHIY